MGVSRTRNFACVVYPESAPEDWLSILKDEKVSFLASPLHELDINPTGEKKKPHYHVMIMFDNVKTSKQAEEIFDKIGGVGCEFVNSIRGYARYLCHLDNPEKARYNENEVVAYGVDYYDIIHLVTDRYAELKNIREFIQCNCITSYAALFDYCAENNDVWFRLLCDNSTYIIKEYLKSMKWELDNSKSEPQEVHNIEIVYMD